MARTLVSTITNQEETLQDLVLTSISLVTLPSGSSVDIGKLRVDLTSDLIIDTSVVGLGGLDAVLVPDTFYTAYVVLDSGTPQIIASSSDIQPIGYTEFKKVGKFYVDGVLEIVNVRKTEFDRLRYVISQFTGGSGEQITVYNDGWVVQGDFISAGNVTVTYPISYAAVDYSLQVTKNQFNINSERPDWGITGRTVNNFTVNRGTAGGDGWYWVTEGYADPTSLRAQGIYID